MSDYIKREDAIREAAQAVDEWDGGYITSRDDMIEAYLNDIPAADVRENVIGHWVNLQVSITGAGSAECSVCGSVIHDSFTHTINFCPNCGADMRGETE